MEGVIYLVCEEKGLLEMREIPFDAEEVAQRLLADYPGLLAGDQITPGQPRRWLLVDQELGVPKASGGADQWAVDLLLLDQDGIPTLVEVKRSTDTRIRREVVGQMLDYAANAVLNWSVDRLREKFESRCKTERKDPEEELLRHLVDPESDLAGFWRTVETNLRAGRIRLIFVADVIPPELQRIVEFLRKQMQPAEVLAVEVKQYAGEGQRALVSRLVAGGQSKTVIDDRTLSGWNRKRVFSAMAQNCGEKALQILQDAEAWAMNLGLRVLYSGGKKYETANFVIMAGTSDKGCRLFVVRTDCKVEFWFRDMTKLLPPFDDQAKRSEIIARLNQIPGVNISEDKVDGYPVFAIQLLAQPEALKQFLAVFDWVIEEVWRYEEMAVPSEG